MPGVTASLSNAKSVLKSRGTLLTLARLQQMRMGFVEGLAELELGSRGRCIWSMLLADNLPCSGDPVYWYCETTCKRSCILVQRVTA